MANENDKSGTATATKSALGQNAKKVLSDRKRREYAHEMSDKERFSLQVVLKAKAACAQIAIAIQEGKGITPEAYKAALSLQEHAGAMLFA